MTLPQLHGAIRVWRLWTVIESIHLRSLVTNYVWSPGVQVADGSLPEHHPGRGQLHSYDHGMGFFGFNDLCHVEQQENTRWRVWRVNEVMDARSPMAPVGNYHYRVAIGSILCFGRVLVAELGVRAEAAKPEYLIIPPDGDEDAAAQSFVIANRYDMKAISLEQAESLKTGLVPYSGTVPSMPKPTRTWRPGDSAYF